MNSAANKGTVWFLSLFIPPAVFSVRLENIGVSGLETTILEDKNERSRYLIGEDSPWFIIEKALAFSWTVMPPQEISIGKMSVSMFCLRIFATQT